MSITKVEKLDLAAGLKIAAEKAAALADRQSEADEKAEIISSRMKAWAVLRNENRPVPTMLDLSGFGRSVNEHQRDWVKLGGTAATYLQVHSDRLSEVKLGLSAVAGPPSKPAATVTLDVPVASTDDPKVAQLVETKVLLQIAQRDAASAKALLNVEAHGEAMDRVTALTIALNKLER